MKLKIYGLSLVISVLLLQVVESKKRYGFRESVKHLPDESTEFNEVLLRLRHLHATFSDVISIHNSSSLQNDAIAFRTAGLIEIADELNSMIWKRAANLLDQESNDDDDGDDNVDDQQNQDEFDDFESYLYGDKEDKEDLINGIKNKAYQLTRNAALLLKDVTNNAETNTGYKQLLEKTERLVHDAKQVETAVTALETRARVLEWKSRVKVQNKYLREENGLDYLAYMNQQTTDVNDDTSPHSTGDSSDKEEVDDDEDEDVNNRENIVEENFDDDEFIYSNVSHSARIKRQAHLTLDTRNLQKFLSQCSKCAEITERRQCSMHSDMIELQRWSGKLQELLRLGCSKPAGCQVSGLCCMKREPTIQRSVATLTQIIKDVHALLDSECKEGCKKDEKCVQPAEWANWGQWSSCDVTCGQGVQERRRYCKSNGSNRRGCEGKSVSVRPCRLPSCCVSGNWGDWAEWSSCSASCGTGVQETSRRCDSPPPNGCGQACHGMSRVRRSCQGSRDCCVDGNWGGWSRWASCSATCGEGLTFRNRKCNSPAANSCGKPCAGPGQERRRCGSQKECCVDGNWGAWASWTGCSVTCGTGQRSRIRRCDSPSPNFCGQRCAGNAKEVLPCGSKTCCVNGNWGAWAGWESCSTSCGRGSQLRRRRCDSPPPNSCGQSCPGKPMDMRACRNPPCCVDGNWSGWNGWSGCSVSCGQGTTFRSRQCSNPSPNNCGRKCPGNGRDSKTCQQAACPPKCRDGNWSSWNGWSACSASCGGGIRSRGRVCNSPPPNSCGRSCPGPREQKDRCNERKCCVDGNWSTWAQWSGCSVSCGYGFRNRKRVCDSPAANYCGKPCAGQPSEVTRCNSGRPCCVDGNWAGWTAWSQCSVSCGTGSKVRSRSCSNPAPNVCGKKCPGSATQQNWCSEKACVTTTTPAPTTQLRCDIAVKWGIWSPWSSCSVSCGTGVLKRIRECHNSRPDRCQTRCPGSAHDQKACNTGKECCPERSWSAWNSWSQCPTTCGSSVIERTRSCPPRTSISCPGSCLGEDTDKKRVACGPEPINGNWSPWNEWDCRGPCSAGVRYKTRSCTNPPPNTCGAPCPGRDAEPCDPSLCEKNCAMREWTVWAPWAQCSKTCGEGGFKRRQMKCEFVRTIASDQRDCGEESYRGCRGERSESKACQNLPMCLGDMSWAEWGKCSATCRGNGIETRQRMVMTPRGLIVMKGRQETRGCYVNSPECSQPWGPWGACSATCRGTGTRERRTIVDLTDLGNVKANATQIETQVCNIELPECPTWGPWGSCSATCQGEGVRQRQTIIRTVLIEGGTIEADARQTETETCYNINGAACPSWTEWSSCSATCAGPGIQERRLRGPVEDENKRPVERRPCTGRGKACSGVTWGEWGPCSATCRGEGVAGVRERRAVVRTILATGVEVEANAVQTETEVCYVRGPQCPPGPTWVTWESWCPCGCNNGLRSRRRECISKNSAGQSNQVDIALCPGEGRQEERCDTRGCPVCIVSCQGKQDGVYPSCTGCNDYITCEDGRVKDGLLQQCPQNKEWDAFINKCVNKPSPSCGIKDCVNSCAGKEDGLYHICGRCNMFVECSRGIKRERACSQSNMEFNQFLGKCDYGHSPTCRRTLSSGTVFTFDRDTNIYGVVNNRQGNNQNVNWISQGNTGGVVPGSGTIITGSGTVISGTGNINPGSGTVITDTRISQGNTGVVVPGSGTIITGSVISRTGNVIPGSGTIITGSGTSVSGSGSTGTSNTIVEGVHAGNSHDGSNYLVINQGSTGGTKVNYNPGTAHTGGTSHIQISNSQTNTNQGGYYGVVTGQGTSQVVSQNNDNKNNPGRFAGSTGVLVNQKSKSNSDFPGYGTGTYTREGTYIQSGGSQTTYVQGAGNKRGTGGSGRGSSGYIAMNADLRNGARFHSSHGCMKSCSGLTSGRYASCKGCQYYLVCHSAGRERTRKCSGNKLWDDVIKKCVRQSSTCQHG